MTNEHTRTVPNDAVQAEVTLPVTLDADRTPVDAQGRYVPHFRDEADTVHFFAVVERPPDSPLPEIAAHELRYFRVPPGEDAQIAGSEPVMPVNDPATSPWPLPALAWYLEEGDLAAAQALARDTAEQFSLPRTPETRLVSLRHRAGGGSAAGRSGWHQRRRGRCLRQPRKRRLGGALAAAGRVRHARRGAGLPAGDAAHPHQRRPRRRRSPRRGSTPARPSTSASRWPKPTPP